jgi:predicted nucleic acid-binding protein
VTGHIGIVLDANILLRAAFGRRVREILKKNADQVRFYAPDVAFRDARKYVIEISASRQVDAGLGLSVLDQIATLIEPVDQVLYAQHEGPARDRIAHRDPDDWPVVAVALLLKLPIWTEDQDFFGRASRLGRQTALSCTFVSSKYDLLCSLLSAVACRPEML